MKMKRRKRYSNMYGVSNDKTLADMRRWQRERRGKPTDDGFTVPQCEQKQIEMLQSNRTQTTITWIGHSTFLIQCGGLNIVTDPVWARRMGFAKRLSEPGLAIRDLPPIDVALISHGHYDHLHIRSLRLLPGQPALLVPEGLADMLHAKGFPQVEEVPWWDSKTIDDVRFTMVPAQHWTRRTLWDTNTSHWGGWMIHCVQGAGDSPKSSVDRTQGNKVRVKGFMDRAHDNEDGVTEYIDRQHDDEDGARPERCIYFAGDSGYFPGFAEIGKRFSIETALLPIGAYDPEWFMSVSHMTPEEAVQAFIDIDANHFIPMHYGAYRLADDTAGQALARLHAAWADKQLHREALHILRLGETFVQS